MKNLLGSSRLICLTTSFLLFLASFSVVFASDFEQKKSSKNSQNSSSYFSDSVLPNPKILNSELSKAQNSKSQKFESASFVKKNQLKTNQSSKNSESKNQETKIRAGDFYIAPQAFKRSAANQNLVYGVKTKIGYDVNEKFSAFAGYDAADVAINTEQRRARLRPNRIGNGVMEVGSQVKISDDAHFSVSYSQNRQNLRQENNSSAQRNANENAVKIGTSVKF